MVSQRTYQRRIRKLVGILESIEFIHQGNNSSPECPCCHIRPDDAHESHCELARAINRRPDDRAEG